MISLNNSLIGITVEFTDECIDILMPNRQDKSKSEGGGLLFAEPIINSLITISNASLPTNKDRSGKYFFKPDPISSQAIINHQFGKKLAYVGDWHTHPIASPRPSCKDIATIKSIFTKSTHSLNYILMIIIGTSDNFSNNYFCLSDSTKIYELI